MGEHGLTRDSASSCDRGAHVILVFVSTHVQGAWGRGAGKVGKDFFQQVALQRDSEAEVGGRKDPPTQTADSRRGVGAWGTGCRTAHLAR